MDKLLKQLIPPVSVSGREQAVRDVIAKLAKPLGDVSTDHLGNLVVHKPGSGKRIMLAAHMDSVGLIVTYVEKEGFARVAPIGGLRPALILGQRVRFENGAAGVICCDRDVKIEDLSFDTLYIDAFGQTVEVGMTAVFWSDPVFAGSKVMSSFLDNRLGCAVCLQALAQMDPTDNEIFCVFTVQEEVGIRGAKPAAYAITPDLAIAVDICGIADTPGKTHPNALTLEGGPVVKIMDARVICHETVIGLLEQTASDLGISTQRYVTKRGGTDAGAIFNTRGGVPSGVLSIPIRYTHSPNEIADLNTAADCARLLAAAITR